MGRIASMVAVSVLVLGSVACSSAGGGGNDDGGAPADGSAQGDGSATGPDGSSRKDGGGGGGGPFSLQFPAMCPALSACGGSLEGTTWDYTAGCVDNPFGQAKQFCPSLQVQNPMGSGSGTLEFSGGKVTRKAKITTSATLVIPPACTMGVIPCSTIQTQLANVGIQGTCAGSGGTCNCNVTQVDDIDEAGQYAVVGNTVVVNGANEYDFCVQGGKMGHRAKDQKAEPGTYELTKR
jgi:hypothetical protein